MDRTSFMRGVLWLGAFFNFSAALMLAFPQSLGRVIGLPTPGSMFYPWMLALLIGIFAGVYAWLARRPQIDRPLVVVAAIGKVGVFMVAMMSWLLGEIPGRGLMPAVGDLIFAAVFLWWLQGESP
ncbi:MAG: hypothetical protein VKJ24_09780 [Synechococcales bacterium]|nr:hypothetical protein [Synechococcales bacterium]